MFEDVSSLCKIRQVGDGVKHHFLGYYNKNPWDVSGRFLLAQRVDAMAFTVSGKEVAEVGYFDLEEGDNYRVIGKTTTWNWQMGSQLQWLLGSDKKRIIYNARSSECKNILGDFAPFSDFCSIIYDCQTQEQKILALPIYVVFPQGDFALSVNYSRFQVTHKTIGYCASNQEPVLELAPKDDGIFKLNLDTGNADLLVSLDDLKKFNYVDSMEKAIHWVTHLEVSPNGKRFLFLHRWTERVEDETCFLHRLIVMDSDGKNIKLLECSDHPLPQLNDNFDSNSVGVFDYEKSEYQISHPAWKNDNEIIVWGPHNKTIAYHLYNVDSGDVKVIGKDLLNENGHMTYSLVNQDLLLSDTYPDSLTNKRDLFIYSESKHKAYSLGSFYTSPDLGKENRCDLHPVWKQDGKQVCIDSVHESSRQKYIVDVTSFIKKLG